jgi:hypothetical protein
MQFVGEHEAIEDTLGGLAFHCRHHREVREGAEAGIVDKRQFPRVRAADGNVELDSPWQLEIFFNFQGTHLRIEIVFRRLPV